MQVEQIISKLGGIRPTANKLGVAVSTVQGWKERNHIPIVRRQNIENILGQGIFTDDIDNTINNNNKDVKKIEKHNKNPKNINFLLYFSLFFSVSALVLSITSHLWRGILFPKIDNTLILQNEIDKIKQKIIIIDEKSTKNDEKSIKIDENSKKNLLNIEYFAKDINDNISKFKQELDKKSAEIQKNSDGLNSFLESSNEKVIKIRQIIAVALIGEDFSLLLKNISTDNPNIQEALNVLQINKSGIYTKQMLIKYINDHILELSEHINYKNAKTPLEKIKAKISGAIYIRSQDKKQNDTVSNIIKYIQQDDFDSIIDLLDGTNSYYSNNLKQLIIAREKTLNALNTLSNWVE